MRMVRVMMRVGRLMVRLEGAMAMEGSRRRVRMSVRGSCVCS